jgi:hypothetical protein
MVRSISSFSSFEILLLNILISSIFFQTPDGNPPFAGSFSLTRSIDYSMLHPQKGRSLAGTCSIRAPDRRGKSTTSQQAAENERASRNSGIKKNGSDYENQKSDSNSGMSDGNGHGCNLLRLRG